MPLNKTIYTKIQLKSFKKNDSSWLKMLNPKFRNKHRRKKTTSLHLPVY